MIFGLVLKFNYIIIMEAYCQGWEFALLLFLTLLFCSCCSFKKSNGVMGAISSCRSRAKEGRAKEQFLPFKSDLLFLRGGVEEKTSNLFFSACFSSFYAQNKRANHSRCSFKKWDESDFPFFLVTHLLSKNKQFT